MHKVFGQSDPAISKYAEETFRPSDKILLEIVERSSKHGLPEIQVSPMDGLHLEVITRAIGAKKVVEIGSLGGYSGTCICRGMGAEGKLFCFEMDEGNAEVVRESLEKAGFKTNAEVIVGPALLNLPRINKLGPFDLVFIDADKENYPNYLKWATQNLKVGGVILADNTFAWGEIGKTEFDKNPSENPAVAALRVFNRECAQNGHFRSTILPTGEGLTFAVKI